MKTEAGKNIKKYREAASLTQQELAKRLLVTRQTISNWERGVSLPDIESIKRIAQEFHVDAVDILYEKKPVDNLSLNRAKIVKSIVSLGISFFICLVLLIFLVPFLYEKRLYNVFFVTLYCIAYSMIAPASYAIGISLVLSTISLWFDFRIGSIRACRAMLIISFSLIFLYIVFMLFTLLGPYIDIYLDEILHTSPLFNWLISHPVIFIFPGALLFFGFYGKTPTFPSAQQGKLASFSFQHTKRKRQKED